MIRLAPETERLARLLAARSRRTPEDVVKAAVETEARRAGVAEADGTAAKRTVDLDRAREIARRVASRPLLDPRPPREILDEAWDRTG